MRGAGRHVTGILLVAWRIDDDEAPGRRLEIAPGDVDGDTLLALGLEPVEQKAEIDPLAVEGAVVRSERDRRALVLGNPRCVPKQPSNQRRFAIVDRAAREQPDHAGPVRLRYCQAARSAPLFQRSSDMHQKYPSRFFTSRAPA